MLEPRSLKSLLSPLELVGGKAKSSFSFLVRELHAPAPAYKPIPIPPSPPSTRSAPGHPSASSRGIVGSVAVVVVVRTHFLHQPVVCAVESDVDADDFEGL